MKKHLVETSNQHVAEEFRILENEINEGNEAIEKQRRKYLKEKQKASRNNQRLLEVQENI